MEAFQPSSTSERSDRQEPRRKYIKIMGERTISLIYKIKLENFADLKIKVQS
jgi:hypothetical protein